MPSDSQSKEQHTSKIKGVDIYDPMTGQIRKSSTDDIACWFIDTEYNGKSFFVRHAYFTGADEPYEKLKRALRADIDGAAWSSLYSVIPADTKLHRALDASGKGKPGKMPPAPVSPQAEMEPMPAPDSEEFLPAHSRLAPIATGSRQRAGNPLPLVEA